MSSLKYVEVDLIANDMNNEIPTEWTDADFDSMGWHDNTIHGISISNPSEGYDFDLTFEIDYILEWISTAEEPYKFSVSPATLTFKDVDKLKYDIELGYKESMIIDEITRQKNPGFNNYRWIIHIQSVGGRDNKIEFDASGFKQVLTSEPLITKSQDLES